MDAATRDLLVDMVEFVDRQHDYRTESCHPTPGRDCWDHCPACKLIGRMQDSILAEARARRIARES